MALSDLRSDLNGFHFQAYSYVTRFTCRRTEVPRDRFFFLAHHLFVYCPFFDDIRDEYTEATRRASPKASAPYPGLPYPPPSIPIWSVLQNTSFKMTLPGHWSPFASTWDSYLPSHT